MIVDVVEPPPRREGPVPALPGEIAFQHLLNLMLGLSLTQVNGGDSEEGGVEHGHHPPGSGQIVGFEVERGEAAAERHPESEGAGRGDEQQDAEEWPNRPFHRLNEGKRLMGMLESMKTKEKTGERKDLDWIHSGCGDVCRHRRLSKSRLLGGGTWELGF